MRIKFVPHDPVTPEQLAQLARLRYVSDSDPGIVRQRNGKGFVYLASNGKYVRAAHKLARIEKLAIPPAWREVWICRFANGHLQVTGRDDRERKQYLYHARWREISDQVKFWRLRQFGRLLPRLREAAARDLAGRGLTRNRVLGGMISLLDVASIRVGNEEYARDNGSFGLTTLRNRHIISVNDHLELRFRAKGGFRRAVVIQNARLTRLLQECTEVRGAHVFQYIDDRGKARSVDAIDVNEYLRELTKQSFTAKDFRTWKASALVAGILFANRDATKATARKRVVKKAVEAAAESLGNTTTVCRKYYIHPGLFASYLDGSFLTYFERFSVRRRPRFSSDEQILARFIRRWKAQA